MTEVRFYLTPNSVERVVPALAEKIVASKERGLLLVETQREGLHWDHVLWTYATSSFLPHAFEDQERMGTWVQRQPLLISCSDGNANQASAVINLRKDLPGHSLQVSKILEIDSSREALLAKRHLYALRYPQCVTQFWRQTEDGKWHQEELELAA